MREPHENGSESARPLVLVVDDTPANLVALQALLGDLPCEVILSGSGRDALEQLSRAPFAVVLLDVMMPGMDGYEVARRAHENPRTRDVPIIFLTAMNESEESAVRGYGLGAVDFLFKPINASILRSKVRVFLDLYESRQRLTDANAALERSLAELKVAQAQLVQSAKMASLGEFVAGIAHEINNPLSFVISHLETARRSLDVVGADIEGELSPRAAEHWHRARSRQEETRAGLERIRDLVVKLRTFSRMDEGGEPRLLSFRECADFALQILGHRLSERIRVVRRFDAPDELEGQPGPLNQVLLNLIANAIEAMGDSGMLTLTTSLQGDDYVITVGDTGRGIPQHLRDRVFEPFFTTKPVGQGTGLGLAIAYAIVRGHAGKLSLHSEEGRGTVATIRLPRGKRDGGRNADERG